MFSSELSTYEQVSGSVSWLVSQIVCLFVCYLYEFIESLYNGAATLRKVSKSLRKQVSKNVNLKVS